MFCTQCGCKIEDGFKFCPECGNAIGESQNQEDNRTELEKIADDICEKYLAGEKRTNAQWVAARKEMQNLTGLGINDSMDLLHFRRFGITRKEARAIHKEEFREMNKQANQDIKDSWNRVTTAFSKDKTARCPRCRSTSISYGQKPSIGGAAVGYGLAGGAGAVVGGMTGKKGYAVCLKCGKRWKI